MEKRRMILCVMSLLLLCPVLVHAQDSDISDGINSLEATLTTVYKAMIVKCGDLVTIGRGIAGLGALLYIANKVWSSIARAQPIDFYPLLRPFCIGMIIGIFPAFINTFNGVLQPTVTGTAALVGDSKKAIATMLERKAQMEKQSNEWKMYVGESGNGSLEKWEELSGEADDSWISGVSNRVKFELSKIAYSIKSKIRLWISEFLEILYEAAALCVNTVRIFYLIILAILGPLVFGISVFDGLHHILINWIARYVNVFLWLPIANVFSSMINQIQIGMIQLDMDHLQRTGDSIFDATALAYLVFLILAIVGYTTVPSIANWIINPGSAGGHLAKMTNVSQYAMGATGAMDKAVGEKSLTTGK